MRNTEILAVIIAFITVCFVATLIMNDINKEEIINALSVIEKNVGEVNHHSINIETDVIRLNEVPEDTDMSLIWSYTNVPDSMLVMSEAEFKRQLLKYGYQIYCCEKYMKSDYSESSKFFLQKAIEEIRHKKKNSKKKEKMFPQKLH